MTLLRVLLLSLVILALEVNGSIVKRQADTIAEDEQEAVERQLCKDKGPGEWFRLDTADCRSVVQCTDAGLQYLRCPHGLAFDLEGQTCNWKAAVTNCGVKTQQLKIKPKLNTVEPLCQAGFLACGNGDCYTKEKFCDGVPDCTDGSDENACDINSDPNRADRCDDSCQLPDCFCQSDTWKTPGGKDPAVLPQMVMITFDDAINNNNIDLYLNDIFTQERLNPHGCTIKGTFFVSHKYTNYTAVEQLYYLGHEMAVHSISHNDSETYWSSASKDEWTAEMAGMRDILVNYGRVDNESIFGVRAPYLRVGGNNQFNMMEQARFIYDSTITAPLQNPPYWPYTLGRRIPHICHGNSQNCPTRSFPAWEIVMNELDRRDEPTIDDKLSGCAMVDSCFSTKPSYDQFKRFLDHNFNRVYDTNRAPLGLFFHSAFLKNDHDILSAFTTWIDEILLNYNDVYFVTMYEVLQWMTAAGGGPEITQVQNFPPWNDQYACNPPRETICSGGNNCRLGTSELPGETIHLTTCNVCPNSYPWVLNPLGQ